MKQKYLEVAKAVALSSAFKFRVGAVLVRKQRIIAAKCNSLRTHPFLKQFTPFPHLHAEAATILAAGLDRADGCELYVSRIGKDGRLRLAKPCEGICQPLMKMAGVRRAFYTISEDEWGCIEL